MTAAEPRVWLAVAAFSGTTAVLLGAFGAHGLRGGVSPEALESYRTAAVYQLLHSVVLLALALYAEATGRRVRLPALLVALGILLFSGSIYGLVLTEARWLGPLTPIGGVSLVAGWLALAGLLRPSNPRARADVPSHLR